MSRPATAAQSSSRTQAVESRASRRRSVSAMLVGMGSAPACALRDAAAGSARGRRTGCRRCVATSARSRPWPRPGPARPLTIASTSAASRPVRGSCCAVPARAISSGRRLGVAVGADEEHPARRQRSGPGSRAGARRLVGPLQVVEHHHHQRAAARGRHRQRRPRRTAGTGRRRRRRLGVTRVRRASSSQTCLAELGRRQPVARSTCDHGQYGGAPCPPSRTRAAPAQSGPASSISAASTAVLPMPPRR